MEQYGDRDVRRLLSHQRLAVDTVEVNGSTHFRLKLRDGTNLLSSNTVDWAPYSRDFFGLDQGHQATCALYASSTATAIRYRIDQIFCPKLSVPDIMQNMKPVFKHAAKIMDVLGYGEQSGFVAEEGDKNVRYHVHGIKCVRRDQVLDELSIGPIVASVRPYESFKYNMDMENDVWFSLDEEERRLYRVEYRDLPKHAVVLDGFGVFHHPPRGADCYRRGRPSYKGLPMTLVRVLNSHGSSWGNEGNCFVDLFDTNVLGDTFYSFTV